MNGMESMYGFEVTEAGNYQSSGIYSKYGPILLLEQGVQNHYQ